MFIRFEIQNNNGDWILFGFHEVLLRTCGCFFSSISISAGRFWSLLGFSVWNGFGRRGRRNSRCRCGCWVQKLDCRLAEIIFGSNSWRKSNTSIKFWSHISIIKIHPLRIFVQADVCLDHLSYFFVCFLNLSVFLIMGGSLNSANGWTCLTEI